MIRPIAAAVVASVLAVGCGGGGSDAARAAPTPVIDPGDGGRYTVDIDPAMFSSRITNPFKPLLPGSVWVYEATDAEGAVETITVTVLDQTRTIMGVEAVVVHDVVTLDDGTLIEDTYDWFAQDAEGNVWYFGEDTTSYADGQPDTAGAWEAGVDGALPGIVMKDTPVVSDIGYRQEYLPGEAEDMGQVIAFDRAVTVPAGSYTGVVITQDWTPLEPDAVEEKAYAPGVGFIREIKTSTDGSTERVVLISFTPGR